MNPEDTTYGHLLPGWIDASLSDADHAEAARMLQADSAFAAEVASAVEVRDALYVLGAEQVAAMPVVDLLPGVLQLVHEDEAACPLDDAESELEAVLMKSSAFADGDIELVDFTASLSAMLPMDDEEFTEPALEAALFALGGVLTRETQQVDLWSALQERIQAEDAEPDNIVQFPSVRAPHPRAADPGVPSWWRSLALVAAGMLIVFAFYAVRDNQPSTLPGSDVAGNEQHDPSGLSPVDDVQLAGDPNVDGENSGTKKLRPSHGNGVPPGPRAKPDEKARPVTLKEVVGEYRMAMQQDASALKQMASWASLTREEAAALLEQAGVSNEAVIGATQFLDVEDALKVLQAAVDNAPDDPYLRYALADRYKETEDTAGYQQALNEWRQSDPENAMPYYLEAQMMMAQGNMGGAMMAMNTGNTLPGANAYASNTARNHAAALEASGYDRDSARFLAASTAGTEESDSLQSMSDNLMDQARNLEAQGQYDAAADLYDSVRVLGEQVSAMADMPQTQLVGYQIQQSAVSAMMMIQDVWTPDTLQTLSTMAESVLDGISQLTGLLTDISGFLGSDDLGSVLDFTNAILSGDLGQLLDLTSQ